jgi:hypothetical protein
MLITLPSRELRERYLMSTRAKSGRNEDVQSDNQELGSTEMTMNDLEINELLSGVSTDADRIPDDPACDSAIEDTGTFAEIEVLMPPEEIFPDEDAED